MEALTKTLHPTHALISLGAFRHNFAVVRDLVGAKVKVMAVVKSNAYGHGVKILAREAVLCGAEYLAVARVDEGCELRKEGIDRPTLVFELAPEHQILQALENELDLTVATLSSAQRVNEAARRLQKKGRIHIKFDTGMGRLGPPFQEAASLIVETARLNWIDLVGVYSHFATSDEADQTYAHEQLNRFEDVLSALERAKIEVPLKHMANSGAIMTLPHSHFDMVRPGIMLYGFTPRKGMTVESRLKPVMSLRSCVSFMKTVKTGSSVSYGRRFIAGKETRIATVPIGYADGYARNLTNKSFVLIRGKRYPVVGTVCMDHLMVDVGFDANIQEGDPVTLIGRDGEESVSGWELSEHLGTIPYEITCMVSARVPRVTVE